VRGLLLITLLLLWISIGFLGLPCTSESDEEFCKLGEAECGYLLKGTDTCGKKREVLCSCNNEMVCKENLTCRLK
jgi:hypothetical protein